MLEMGQATLELFDERQAEVIDQLEAGKRVSGQIRLALQVPDLPSAMKRALDNGAILVPGAVPVDGVVTAPPAGATPEYGKYVATLGDCRGCHGPDMTGAPATSFSPAVPNPRPFVGTLTLEEFVQSFRTGVRPDGTAFSPAMPWQTASRMMDEDLAALYVYLTTQP